MAENVSANATESSSLKKKRIFIGLGVFLALVLLWLALKWVFFWRFLESTDDAYVQGDIVSITPKVSSYIADIPVHNNQSVKKGTILFRLDDGDYKNGVNQTESKLATQMQTLQRIKAQIAAAQTNLRAAQAGQDEARAVSKNAQLSLERVLKLHASGYVSNAQLDSAKTALAQANANVTKAEAQMQQVQANIKVLQAQLAEAQTGTHSLELVKEKAERDLGFTVLTAPCDGVLGNLSAKKGDFVVNGQRIASLVPIEHLYVEANFKETQLPSIHVGAPASVSLDALDGKTIKGRVISVSPASGAVFSLLPPQNATGNFTKVIQRFPVRIALDPESLKTGAIRAGMSAVITIDTRDAPIAPFDSSKL